MIDTRPRLVLVEGVPFTGKSTHSEFLATQLDRNGIAAEWVSEGKMLKQYFPQVMAALDQKQSVSEALLWEGWTGFAQAVTAASSLFVVDSALSCAAVFPLLAEDHPTAAVFTLMRRIASLCAPLRPRVLHLTGDVERLVSASIAERGEGWREHLVGQADATPYQQARGRTGVAGVTQMLAEEQALMHRALEEGGWQTLTLDISTGDWRASERAILASLGQHQRAIADYDRAIDLDPDYAMAYHNRGNAYARLNQYRRAMPDYDRAIELNAEYCEAYYNRGIAYSHLGQPERAIADYDRAITLKPDFVEAYSNRGNVYADLGQHQRAIADYDRVIELSPEDPGGYYNRGHTYDDLDQKERAIEDYNRAIALSPRDARIYTERGNVYARQGKTKQAMEDYNQAISLDPGNALAHLNKGVSLADKGAPPTAQGISDADALREALVCFEKAAQLGEPDGAKYAAWVRKQLNR